jgi:hypothetical protein
LSVGVLHTTKLTLSMSSQVIWTRETGGPGALLVSPFNVKCRFSAPAGGVEGSKFCLFLVVFPARCVSSVSPKFHYRRHAFCSLPLAAILESLTWFLQRHRQYAFILPFWKKHSWASWHKLVIPTLRKLRQEYLKLKVIMGYIMKSCLKK